MSLTALFVAAAVAAGQPAPKADTPADTQANLLEVDAERTPMRCRPAPYYVADRGERPRASRVFVTGSRVPMSVRDLAERRTRPCFLMRDDPDILRGIDTPPNPLRTAD